MSTTHAPAAGHVAGHAHGEPHVMSVGLHIAIFLALLALLFLTIAIAFVDLGSFGLAVAMVIATVKAALILMYFMHVKFSPPLVWLFSTAAFFWLLIMLAFSFNDFFTRGWLAILGK